MIFGDANANSTDHWAEVGKARGQEHWALELCHEEIEQGADTSAHNGWSDESLGKADSRGRFVTAEDDKWDSDASDKHRKDVLNRKNPCLSP